MMKVYDRVHWHFIAAMMRDLGFPENMINLIMKCVFSVRFSVKVNGKYLPHLCDRIRSKVTGWDKVMSDAGNEVMIKPVLQAMSTYRMSCFQLSKGSCQKIISLVARCWWSGSLDKKAMHWLAWDKL
jgi:hypothetical protein